MSHYPPTFIRSDPATYQYCLDNNLKSVVYSGSLVPTPGVAYTYDSNYNRIQTMTDGAGTTTYAYNPIGSPPTLGAGRLASVDGPLANDTVEYVYDALGRVSRHSIGGVGQAAVFDALGRVTTITNALGTFSNVYVGATSRVSTNFYPNGQTTTFAWYDNLGDHRLQQIRHLANGAPLSTFSYTHDADGQIATWTQQADAQTPAVWVTQSDPVDQLLGVTVRSGSAQGGILKEFAYNYDSAGNRLGQSVKTSSSALLTSASYNALNQLTAISGGGAVRFSGTISETGRVSVAGSRALVSHGTNFASYPSLAAGTNTVSITATDLAGNTGQTNYQIVVTNSGVAETLTYDLNGNQVSVVTPVSTNTYEWDAADRLIRITQLSTNNAQLTSEFTYDGLGRRVQAVEKQNGIAVSTNKFVWVGLELAEERDSTGGRVTKRFFAQGQQTITLKPQPSTLNLFYTRDHLGSVREMTDASRAVRARYDYDPFGRRTKISGDLEAGFGFTGHYFHPASGLCLAPYRAYDPATGRWLNRDPIEEAGGINLYMYVDNNPTTNVDPAGTSALLVLLLVGTATALAVMVAQIDLNRTSALASRDEVERDNISGYGTLGQTWAGQRARESLDAGWRLADAAGNNSVAAAPFSYASPSGAAWHLPGKMYLGSTLPPKSDAASVAVKVIQKALKYFVSKPTSDRKTPAGVPCDGYQEKAKQAGYRGPKGELYFGSNPQPGYKPIQ